MPNALVDKVVQTCGKPKAEVEHLWTQAEEIAKKQYKLKELSGKEYAIVTGIFKKSIGNDCAKKLGWLQEELQMSYLEKLLLEAKKKKDPAKVLTKGEELPDVKELAKDAAETMQMDKMNITAEHKLVKDMFSLISEAKTCMDTMKKMKNAPMGSKIKDMAMDTKEAQMPKKNEKK